MTIAVRVLGTSVAPAWAICLVSAASALLLAAVGSRVAELVEISAAASPSPVTLRVAAHQPPLSGELKREGRRWRAELAGDPGATVLLLSDGRPLTAVTLDEAGRASTSPLDLQSGSPSLQIVYLGTGSLVLRPPPAPGLTRPSPPVAGQTGTPTPDPTAALAPRTATARGLDSPPVLHLVADAGPRIALTFDGGATAQGTAELLDLLDRLDLRASIFLTGEFIVREPDLVRRIVLQGHEVGNHTFSHPHLTSYARTRRHDLLPGVTKELLEHELLSTEDAFRRATGRSMAPLWRAPFGEENARLRAWALDLGYLHVRWSSLEGASLDSRDWVDDEHNPMYLDSKQMVARLLRFPELRGGIVLMHVASQRPEPPWSALPEFVTGLSARGIEPVPVSNLLEGSRMWGSWLRRASHRHHERALARAESDFKHPPALGSSGRSQ